MSGSASAGRLRHRGHGPAAPPHEDERGDTDQQDGTAGTGDEGETAAAGSIVDRAGLLRGGTQSHAITPAGAVLPLASGPCASSARLGEAIAGPLGGRPPTADGVSALPFEVALSWTGNADLDVWVQTPSGDLVSWSWSQPGAGRLDLDVVPPTPDAIGPHVERVMWPAGTAISGVYTAWARFQSAGWGSQSGESYVLTARTGDEVLGSVSGGIGATGTKGAQLAVELSE